MEQRAHSHGGPQAGAIAEFVARHERALIAAWLALCVALVAAMGVWGLALNGAERAVDAWDERWVRELDHARALLDQEQLDEATALLERLDRDCPATFVKHRHDRERERLLHLLGEAYLRADRKKRALDAFGRAAAFDPKNFNNHFRLAEAARQLGEDDVARAAYEAVLAIHPTHAPSVAALADMSFAAGNYAPVVDLFERYIDAWQLATVHVAIGEQRIALDLPVDGRAHELELPCSLPAGWRGVARLETRGYSARLESLAFLPPLRAGVAGRGEAVTLAPGEEWIALEGTMDERHELRAQARASALVTPEVTLADGAATVKVRLALFRSVPAGLWKQAEKSFSNRLQQARWRALLERARPGGAPEAGTVTED